jgi:tellurite methyltransferase
MTNSYDQKYQSEEYYWGRQPSTLARIYFQRHPLDRTEKMLDAGCGEGRDTVFFALIGYQVTAFDDSEVGVKKTRERAASLHLDVDVFKADVNAFRLKEEYDFVLANGVFHYVRPELRQETIANYKQFTRPGGRHAVLVPVYKPFVNADPTADQEEKSWRSGEILTHYHDWKIEYFEELIQAEGEYDFAMNRLIAAKPGP